MLKYIVKLPKFTKKRCPIFSDPMVTQTQESFLSKIKCFLRLPLCNLTNLEKNVFVS